MERKKNIRVGHLVNQYGYGTAAGDLTAALNQYTEIDSAVISLREPEDFTSKVQVIYPNNNNTIKKSFLDTIYWLKEVINNFDVIVAHHTLSGLLGSIITQINQVPIISREGNDHQQFSFRVRTARTLTNLMSNEIVCVSQSVVDSYQGFEQIVSSSKFQVINNGVNINEVDSARQNDWNLYSNTNIEPNSKVIGTAGMLIEQKNHSLLLKAIDRLNHQRKHNVHLVIAGNGPLINTLKKQMQDLDITDSVHFVGYLQRVEVYKMLHQIDTYAMPSKWEGFSAAALQAMAVGVPCVFSNIPSFASQYPDDLVYFHDPQSVGDLANALESALNDDKDIDGRGRKFVLDNHTTKIMAKKYANVIQELYSKNSNN